MRWLVLVTFLFYSLNVTGCRIKNFILVGGSCLKDEPIDMVYWVVFLASLITFWINPTIGQWLLFGFFTLSVLTLSLTTIRFMIWPNEKKTLSYNNYFATTHHIIKPLASRLIPDTFHLCILLLVFINFIGIIIYII